MRRPAFLMLPLLACLAAGVVLRAEKAPDLAALATLEKTVAADPENLRAAADYRQLAIAQGQFDRTIDILESLAKRKNRGPNILISHALACVDKVPVAGDLRRLYLGRDAMDSLTKSIALKPTVLAYYIRGVVNLYYNTFIFKRIPRGIADLEQALRMVAPDTPTILIAHVYRSLGDGHWRLDERDKAREVWKTGTARIGPDPELIRRLDDDEKKVGWAVSDALYAGTRVDTSLRGVVPSP